MERLVRSGGGSGGGCCGTVLPGGLRVECVRRCLACSALCSDACLMTQTACGRVVGSGVGVVAEEREHRRTILWRTGPRLACVGRLLACWRLLEAAG